MRPHACTPALLPEADPEILRRWGVEDCEKPDRARLSRGLTQLFVDETDLPPSVRAGARDAVLDLLRDAVSLSIACEAAHARDDQWPHELPDELMDLLERLEQHRLREEGVVLPRLLAGGPGRRSAAQAMAAEHADLEARLRRIGDRTEAFTAPAQACAAWRLLYVVCCRIDLDLRTQMRLEERTFASRASGILRRIGVAPSQRREGEPA